MDIYIYAALAAFFLAVIVKILSAAKSPWSKSSPNLPGFGWKLIYSDEKGVQKNSDVVYSKILVSEKYGLKGKPDFIYEKNNTIMPVELKSGTIGNSPDPRKGDLMQLAAYFLIIEDYYKIRPSFGRLIYKDFMFTVRNTQKIRNELISITKDMRRMLVDGEESPNCEFIKCKSCMCRGTVCEFCDD